MDLVQKIRTEAGRSLSAQLQTRLYALPILLAIGIGLYFIWPQEPGLIGPFLGTILLMAAAWSLAALEDRSWRYLILLALMTVLAGFTAAKIRALVVWTPMIDAPLGPLGVEGRVAALEQLEGGSGLRLILDQLQIKDLPSEKIPQALRLSVRKGGADLMLGMRVRVFAKIEPASRPPTPGGFDFRRHAYFKGIGGYGYVLGAPRVIKPPPQGGWSGIFEKARNHISARVNTDLSPRQAGMVAALLTGERAAIGKEDWQALRDSGLAHLLAISGANVDMVALIVFFLVRLALAAVPSIALRYPIKKYAAAAAFLAALFYVLLIYPSTPTLRALLTIGIVLFAVMIDRSPISLRLVCASAFLILLFQPEQLLSPSFQLSFAAVGALVAVFEWVAPWLKRVHRDAGMVMRGAIYLISVCATTVIATIATAPISLYHFQTLALYGVLANALAVPLMTFVMMPLALLCYPAFAWGGVEPILRALGFFCEWILEIAHVTAELPGARFTPPAMPLSALLWIITGGLILIAGARWFKALAVVPVIAVLWVLAAQERPVAVVLAAGKVVMMRQENGEIVTNTRRYARRRQGDWVRYWGGDEDKGARVFSGLSVPGGRSKDLPQTNAPVAIYKDHIKIVGPRVSGRLWD